MDGSGGASGAGGTSVSSGGAHDTANQGTGGSPDTGGTTSAISGGNSGTPSGGASVSGGASGSGGSTAGGTFDGGATLALQLGAPDAVTRLAQVLSLPSGGAIIVGSTNGAVDPNGPYGFKDALIASVTDHGSVKWLRQIGAPVELSPIYITPWGATLTASGTLVLTGLINGKGSFRGQPLNSLYSTFVAAYSADTGQESWFRILGGTDGATEAMDIAALADGTLAIGGASSASMLEGQASLGGTDVFVAWYSPAGTLLQVRRYGGASEEYPTAFASNGHSIYFSRKIVTGSGATEAIAIQRLSAEGVPQNQVWLESPAQRDVVKLSAAGSGVCAALVFTAADSTSLSRALELKCLANDLSTLGSTRFGSAGDEIVPTALTCDASSECVVAGYASAMFEGQPVELDSQAFVVAFDAQQRVTIASLLPAVRTHENSYSRVTAVSSATNGQFLIGGELKASMFGPLQGLGDIFVTVVPH